MATNSINTMNTTNTATHVRRLLSSVCVFAAAVDGISAVLLLVVTAMVLPGAGVVPDELLRDEPSSAVPLAVVVVVVVVVLDHGMIGPMPTVVR